MPWYSIRSVYHFGTKMNGVRIFEERIVSLEAASWEEAHEKGDHESALYAAHRGLECHPEKEAYQQDDNAQVSGHEVWSTLFESDMDLAAFFAERYTRFDYTPDP
jgi:hypothetical protein